MDEIGEIDSSIQVKILRALGERSIERVGGIKPIPVDVRVIAATNRDLKKMMDEGKFREDLYYRLNVIQITMPPLRARPEDIPLLVKKFLEEFSHQNQKQVRGFTQEATEWLLAYQWPGNVRQLRSAVEHAVVLARSEEAGLQDLPPSIVQVPENSGLATMPLSRQLNWEENEKQLILKALLKTHGNRTEAALALGISRRTLHRKLKEYGLEEAGIEKNCRS